MKFSIMHFLAQAEWNISPHLLSEVKDAGPKPRFEYWTDVKRE